MRAPGQPLDTYVRAGAYAKLPELPAPGVDARDSRGGRRGRRGRRAPATGFTSRGLTAPTELALCDESQGTTLAGRVSFARGGRLRSLRDRLRALFSGARACGRVGAGTRGERRVGVAAVQLARRPDSSSSDGGTEEADASRREARTRAHPARRPTCGRPSRSRAVRGVDVILGCSPTSTSTTTSRAARRGRASSSATAAQSRSTRARAMTRDADILGISLLNTRPRSFPASRGARLGTGGGHTPALHGVSCRSRRPRALTPPYSNLRLRRRSSFCRSTGESRCF